MNGVQITNTCLSGDTPRSWPAASETSSHLSTGFMHPDDVAGDRWLNPAEKREILASWASDVRAVPNAPALRQLDNGAVVRIDDILRALKSLENDVDAAPTFPTASQPFTGRRARLATRLKSALRRNRSDDDDDPPPCPAVVTLPIRPLAGGSCVGTDVVLAA